MAETARVPTLHQGDDIEINATVYTTPAKTTPKNVTGATVTGRIGSRVAGQTALEAAGSVIDGPAGRVRVIFASAATATLAAARHDIDIEVVDASGKKNNILDDRQIRVIKALPDLP